MSLYIEVAFQDIIMKQMIKIMGPGSGINLVSGSSLTLRR